MRECKADTLSAFVCGSERLKNKNQHQITRRRQERRPDTPLWVYNRHFAR
jgi:hypothetical protein